VAEEKITLWLKVQPNAHRNELAGFKEGVWQIKIATPPVKGKANQELIRYLSQILGVARHQLAIERGINARRKAVSISGLAPSQVRERLEKHYSGLC